VLWWQAELWPQIKALEVRLGWRKPFRVRNAWREVLRQIKVMRAFNPNAKFSLREAGANEQKGSLEVRSPRFVFVVEAETTMFMIDTA